jgi:UDP-glucose 4-epimerase
MTVFCKSGKINEKTPLIPYTKYGDSKIEAEDYLISKKDEIKITIIRSPMIFGINAPGNAKFIEKISKILPFFPSFNNKRSFVEINNLCKILYNVLVEKSVGIIHPSSPTMSTFDLFKYYRNSRFLIKISFLNSIIRLSLKNSFLNKIFGDLYYDFDSFFVKF